VSAIFGAQQKEIRNCFKVSWNLFFDKKWRGW